MTRLLESVAFWSLAPAAALYGVLSGIRWWWQDWRAGR